MEVCECHQPVNNHFCQLLLGGKVLELIQADRVKADDATEAEEALI